MNSTRKATPSARSSPTTSSRRCGPLRLSPSYLSPADTRSLSLSAGQNRVVGQIKSERNFHIFYQLTKGASAAQREAYGLQGPEAYAYTSKSGCLEVPGIDDTQDWAETIKAMGIVGLSQVEQDNILRMLASILWIGNVEFRPDQDGNAAIKDESVTAFVAYLLEVDPAQVGRAMTSRIMETQRGGRRGSVYEVPLNPAQAASVRDALAKAVYNNLFEWIVDRVNVSMRAKQQSSTIIGVLDIYGFEIFDTNQFEQLCINYVNEKLQQIFIQLTLKTEQEEYVREQIKWTPIDYFNNKIVCDLIEEKRPPGLFAALNDACATAHADPTAADNSFVQRMGGISNPQFEPRGSKFLVKHYAGDVMYTVAGMTDKNKDVLLKDLLDLVGSSGNQFLQGLFPDRPDPDSKKRPPTAGDKIKVRVPAPLAGDPGLTLPSLRSRRPTRSSTSSCARSRTTSAPSSPTRTVRRPSTTQRPSCTRSSTSACRRTSASAALALRTATPSRRWLSGACPPAVGVCDEQTPLLIHNDSCVPRQLLPPVAGDVVRGRLHLARRRADRVRADPQGHGHRARRVADGHHQSLHQEPRDALCARVDARQVLAQHGRPHPALLARVPAPQARRGAHDPALLAQQEGGHRLRAAARLRPPDPRGPQGAPPLLARQHAQVHGRLPRGRRARQHRGLASPQRRWHCLCVASSSLFDSSMCG